ncbi:hypothetical protein [Aliiruegeria sabulilitoris]|uniref:hypothetical protein n=1 Tax=Aliiruegeria sabulilitoris TaxID=1510458 RepID=UPI000836EAE1|nr:hypothetical protein [Aliiruegeria sabulilitoris]NDR56623.1 hypothetical protein [Pseudoruegeria sp. M32A2M]
MRKTYLRFPDILVILCLFGLYSQVPLSAGNLFIPNVIGLLTGFLLLTLNGKRLQKNHVSAMLGLVLVVFVGILLSPDVVLYFPARLKAMVQLIISLLAGYGLYLEFRKYSYQKAQNILSGFVVLVIVGSALEIFTPLRGVFQTFSNAFWEYDFERTLIRDLNIAGFSRPIFLTSEPSHVAKGAVIFLISLMLLNPSQKSAVWISAGLIAALAIVRSASVVIGLPMVFSAYYYSMTKELGRRERRKRRRNAVFLVLLIGIPAALAGMSLMEDRISQISAGRDYSASVRLLSGLNIGISGAMEYPIAGVGLGGFASLENIIVDTLVAGGVPAGVAEENWDRQLNNGIGVHFLYFGFFLLPVYLFAFHRLVNRLSGGSGIMIIILMALISFGTGAIYGPRFVMYYFLFSASAYIAALERRSSQALW